MKKIKNISVHILVWFATLAMLLGLLISSAAIPNSYLQTNMEKSALSYADKDAFSFENGKKLNSIADNYADSILLGVAWNMGNGTPTVSAIDTKYYDGEETGENYGLYLSVTEGASPNTNYTRYWHGSAAFVRLLHLFTDVNGVKTIGFAAVLVLLAVTVAMLVLKKHTDIAIMMCVSLFAVQIWNVSLSMEYQPAIIVALIISILCIAMEARAPVTLVFVFSGAAVCFFDFLTTETLSLLLPLMLVICIRAKEKRLGTFKEGSLLSLKCGVAWFLAYAFTFIAKWTLATIVTGRNVFSEAIFSAYERLGSTLEGVDTLPENIFSSVISNIGVMFGAESRLDYVKTFLPFILITALLFSVWYLFRREDGEKNAAKLLLILGAIVILRFLIVNNHSYIHSFFTYRALAPMIFACLAALWFNLGFVKKKRVKK